MSSGPNNKGYDGEREFANICDRASGENYQFERIGMQEANKKWLFGDVAPVKAFNELDIKDSVLSDYFLEAKYQKRIAVWKYMRETDTKASQYDLNGGICFFKKAHGRGKPTEEMIAMRPDVFENIISELQGWRDQFEKGEIIINENYE